MTGAAALGRGMVMRSMIRSRTMLDRFLPMAKAASLNRNISVSVSMTNKGTVLLARLYPFMAKSFSFAGISITGLPHISFAVLRFVAAADPATSG